MAEDIKAHIKGEATFDELIEKAKLMSTPRDG